jgi:hypothetical protein
MALNPFIINKTTSKSPSFYCVFSRFLLIFVRKTGPFHPETALRTAWFSSRFRESNMGGMRRYGQGMNEVWLVRKSFVIKYGGMAYRGEGGVGTTW